MLICSRQLVPACQPRADSRWVERAAPAPKDHFHKGEQCLYFGDDYYGHLGTVTAVAKKPSNAAAAAASTAVAASTSSAVVDVTLTMPAKPRDLGASLTEHVMRALQSVRYTNANAVAQTLSVPPLVFSRLSGSVTVVAPSGRKTDLGLGFKFSRRELFLPGYVRRVTSTRGGHAGGSHTNFVWEYSDEATKMASAMVKRFPDLVRGLTAAPDVDT